MQHVSVRFGPQPVLQDISLRVGRGQTLVVVGEDDQRCPVGQAEQLFVTLKKAGCEVEFARYPGESHGFFVMGAPEHRVDFYQRSLDWFKQHLGEPG